MDPCYSISCIGKHAADFTENVTENSFGPDSFFDRFYRKGGKILNFNNGAGSTYVHYVERCLNVPYRFDKTFTGLVLEGKTRKEAQSTIWVRYLSDDSLTTDFRPLTELCRAKKALHHHALGRGEIGVISARKKYEIIEQAIKERPFLLTRAESLGIEHPNIVPEK